MRILKFDTKELAKQLGCNPELLYSPVCIVDNEISNDLSILSWDYEKADIICSGFLYKDEITIIIREKDDTLDFSKNSINNNSNFNSVLRNHLDTLLKNNTKLFSFNRDMEMGNFLGFLQLEDEIEHGGWSAYFIDNHSFVDEIQPFKSKGFNKDRFYSILIEKRIIPSLILKDKFNGDGKLCIPEWLKYTKTGEIQFLLNIVQHNINCLIKENLILKNKKHFLDNYLIDRRHFMLREKTEEEKNNEIQT